MRTGRTLIKSNRFSKKYKQKYCNNADSIV
jgi:hypothetical protein